MNAIIDAIAKIYGWLGEYLEKVLPAEIWAGLAQLPEIDFNSFKSAE